MVSAVCGSMLGATSVAVAGIGFSGAGYTGNVNGHVYESQAAIITDASSNVQDGADTFVNTSNYASVPAGWMAANARKFKNDALCEETGYQYNTISFPTENAYAHNVKCGSGTYYSYGTFAVWNGSGYDYYYTLKSTSQNG